MRPSQLFRSASGTKQPQFLANEEAYERHPNRNRRKNRQPVGFELKRSIGKRPAALDDERAKRNRKNAP